MVFLNKSVGVRREMVKSEGAEEVNSIVSVRLDHKF